MNTIMHADTTITDITAKYSLCVTPECHSQRTTVSVITDATTLAVCTYTTDAASLAACIYNLWSYLTTVGHKLYRIFILPMIKDKLYRILILPVIKDKLYRILILPMIKDKPYRIHLLQMIKDLCNCNLCLTPGGHSIDRLTCL